MKKMILFALLLVTLSSIAQVVDPNMSCKAYFTYSFTNTIETFAPAAAINFVDLSDGNVVSWNWDFGDSTYSTEQNPLHVFTYPVYNNGIRIMVNPYRTVTLTTTTDDSCIATYSEQINIYDSTEPGGKTCKSDFYFFQTGYDSIARTATFKFMNMSGAESASYLWDFSDGLTSAEAEPEPTFDFSRTDRKVCLTVFGTDSCSDELCQDVYIDPDGWGVDPGDSVTTSCYTVFGYTVNTDIKTFAPALVLDFYAKSDEPIAKCLWDFGDGATSDELNPTHIFNYPVVEDSILGDPNPYRTVCLTVTTESGCESSYCEVIDLYMNTDPGDQCDASFGYYLASNNFAATATATYAFYAYGDNILSWNWSFEDGTISYDPEPLITFDVTSPTQQVCLTILTSDSCVSTWCETIYVSTGVIDTIYPGSSCGYRFKYTSSYPEWASACIGTVTAQVVSGDSLIATDYYYWSTQDGQMTDGPTLNDLCPTQTYTVTALTTDGCKFSGSILFNSDGTVTELPLIWWFSGWGDDTYVEYELPDSSYTVEWIGCDGTVYSDLTILLTQITCDSDQPNMILKDAMGNIVYSETVTSSTQVPDLPDQKNLMIYPNPVTSTLNIRFSSINESNATFEITDLSGKVLQNNTLTNLKTGSQVGINVSSLEPGIYMGKIVSGNRVIAIEKFTK